MVKLRVVPREISCRLLFLKGYRRTCNRHVGVQTACIHTAQLHIMLAKHYWMAMSAQFLHTANIRRLVGHQVSLPWQQ